MTKKPAEGDTAKPAKKILASRNQPGRLSIAVIGDLVGSRKLPHLQRSETQLQLEQLLDTINKRYSKSISARFLVTLGDEFQGVLKQGAIIPDLIWDIEASLANADVRIGVGYGHIHPPFKKEALGMDGPAFHAAREGVEVAKNEKLNGGIFQGFGQTEDILLNSLARLLRHQRERLSKNQLATLALLRQRISQTEIAKRLRITRQAVHSRTKSIGWQAYLQGEEAMRAILKNFDVSPAWS